MALRAPPSGPSASGSAAPAAPAGPAGPAGPNALEHDGDVAVAAAAAAATAASALRLEEEWRREVEAKLWEQAFKLEALSADVASLGGELRARLADLDSSAPGGIPRQSRAEAEALLGAWPPSVHTSLKETQVVDIDFEGSASSALPFDSQLSHYKGPGYTRAKIAGCAVVLFVVLSFVFYSMYKISDPMPFLETERDIMQWQGGEVAMPFTAYAVESPATATVHVHQGYIPWGAYSGKWLTDINITSCMVLQQRMIAKDSKTSGCLPSGLTLGGTFGDELYKYVEIRVFVPPQEVGETLKLLLYYQDQYGPRAKQNVSRMITTLIGADEEHVFEIFLQRHTGEYGGPVGFSNAVEDFNVDELLPVGSPDLWGSVQYVMADGERDRSRRINRTLPDGSRNVLTVLFRAANTEVIEEYRQPNVLSLLQAVGGLYTALSFAVGAGLLLLFRLYATYETEC